MKEYDKLFDRITTARHLVAFTGAGISTLAGIKDFRGKDGLYKQKDTEKMFDIDIFYEDPTVYYNLARDFIYGLDEKEPAIVHAVLAELEEKGFLKALITQNIDLLHQKAGSKNVLEIHGSPTEHYCIQCDYKTSFEEVAKTAKTGEVPLCPNCGKQVKPAITFFGEALPQQAMNQAVQEASNADFMLILGTSLQVYPAASLPAYTLQAGGEIAIVNDQPTQFDSYADFIFDDLEECFEALDKFLKKI